MESIICPPPPLVRPATPKSIPPQPDADAIAETFRMVVGEGRVTELRALDATMGHDRYPSIYSGYFNNANAFADAAMSLHARGIYFMPNPVNPALLARACNRIRRAPKNESVSDKDIVSRRWLLIDCDPLRPTGISSSDTEHEAALNRCGEIWRHMHDELGAGDPIEADSGNGGHLLYQIDGPTNDGGTFARILADLSARFSDDVVKVDVTVHNAARIWRLYGTVNAKGDHIPERPHRLARILRAPREMKVGAR